jgi:HEAT repeat protein
LSGLLALWSIALGITGAALLIMAGLLVARLLTGWRERERAAERQRLVPLLLGDSEHDPTPRMWLADKFIAELMVELIQLVRGSDRERFIARAERLGVPGRLRHQLGSASARIRQTAAEALGLFPDGKSVDGLRHALTDKNPDVRLTAALALAQAGLAPPLRDLVRLLDIGRGEKSLLVNSLFKALGRERKAELEEAVRSPGAPATARIAAAEALASAGSYDAVPLIAEAVLRAPADSRELPRFLRALGALGHPAAAEAVGKGLGSDAPAVRAAAAEAAGRIGLAQFSGRLAELLSDPAWRVRFRAGEALIRLGEEGVARLRRAAAGGTGPAAEAAARTLRERGLE